MRTPAQRRTIAAFLLSLLAAPTLALAEPSTQPLGVWGPVKDWPYPAVHAHLLPTGKVMFSTEFEHGGDPPYLWTPETDTLQPIEAPGYNVFCAGHTFLADGRLFFAGGHIADDMGLPTAATFDPWTLKWTRLPPMAAGRWYPTATTLANGDVLVTAGADEMMGQNQLPEVYSPATRTWRRLTGAPRIQSYYPFNYQAPDGRMYTAGAHAATAWLNHAGTGAWVTGPRTVYNKGRVYGSSVMYEPGKILIVAGDSPPTATAEVINLNDPSPKWRAVAPLQAVRRQNNATLMPDGSVLVTGGHSSALLDDPTMPRKEVELWNPKTEQWTQLAPMGAYRGYHSIAMLLPDGRVLSAGGRRVKTMQIYSPPYMFQGGRPIISAVPEVVTYGQDFTITSAQAGAAGQVTLIRLASVTHAFDENQRFVRLAFKKIPGALTATAPATPYLAPPGHYMLFMVDVQGRPSKAKIIRLAPAVGASTPGTLAEEAP